MSKPRWQRSSLSSSVTPFVGAQPEPSRRPETELFPPDTEDSFTRSGNPVTSPRSVRSRASSVRGKPPRVLDDVEGSLTPADFDDIGDAVGDPFDIDRAVHV